jgi:hypothetical protein
VSHDPGRHRVPPGWSEADRVYWLCHSTASSGGDYTAGRGQRLRRRQTAMPIASQRQRRGQRLLRGKVPVCISRERDAPSIYSAYSLETSRIRWRRRKVTGGVAYCREVVANPPEALQTSRRRRVLAGGVAMSGEASRSPWRRRVVAGAVANPVEASQSLRRRRKAQGDAATSPEFATGRRLLEPVRPARVIRII